MGMELQGLGPGMGNVELQRLRVGNVNGVASNMLTSVADILATEMISPAYADRSEGDFVFFVCFFCDCFEIFCFSPQEVLMG